MLEVLNPRGFKTLEVLNPLGLTPSRCLPQTLDIQSPTNPNRDHNHLQTDINN